jgi:type I restriction enzyme S subunit
LVFIKGGKRLPLGEEFSTQTTSHPYIRARDIGSGNIRVHDAVYLSDDMAQKLSRYRVSKGDVCITIVGANVGEMGVVPPELEGANFTENAVRITGNGKIVQGFLKYALLAEDALAQMKVLAGGAAQPKLGIYKIETVEIPSPPLPTQRKIAAILSAYDDLIENNLRRIKILEEMAQNLYREWFVKFRFPACAAGAAGRPGHQQARFVDSPLGRIPEGWEVVRFSDLIASGLGGDWGLDEPAAEENAPVYVIRGTDFDNIVSGTALRVPRRFITSSSLRRRQLKAWDLLVENSINAKSRCVGTTLLITDGILQRLSDPAIAASFCKVYRLKEPSLAPLAHLHMRNLYREGRMAFYQNVAANGIGNFQSQRFLESEHLVFPSDSQRKKQMLSYLRYLTSSTLADQAFTLRRTRDLLLPKLISGEVDVSELDIAVPEEAIA